MYLFMICVFGFHLGSFLLCMCDQYIQHDFRMRSRCDACKHLLHWYDLIPVISFVACRGKCRYCGSKVSPRYLCSEVGMGLLCMFVVRRTNFCMDMWNISLLCVLVAVGYIDMCTMEIPDGTHIVIILLYMLHASRNHVMWIEDCIRMLGVFGMGVLLYVVTKYTFGRECIGGGDLKLISVMSLYLTIHKLSVVLCVGSLMAMGMMLVYRKERIAFGPFLAIGFFMEYYGVFAMMTAIL